MIYDCTCSIYRTTTYLNPSNNRPIKTMEQVNTEPYLCRLGKRSSQYSNGSPNATITTSWRLYLPNDNYDLKEGDIAEIDGLRYIIENVYVPNNHHIECDVTKKGDA